MAFPDDRKYSETHEWHLVDGDTLTLGLTQHAVDQLTDVTYAEMKPVGTTLAQGDPVGEVESVKTTSDVYSGVAGEIIEVNDAAAADPSVLNTDPHGEGWLVKIRISDPAGLESLVDAETYAREHAR
ncbi:MAG: glycine cleavage system protein GcvH [Planctomycetota bacterium]